MAGPKNTRFYEFRITSRFPARNNVTVNIFDKLLNVTKRNKGVREQVQISDLIPLQNKYKQGLNDTQ